MFDLFYRNLGYTADRVFHVGKRILVIFYARTSISCRRSWRRLRHRILIPVRSWIYSIPLAFHAALRCHSPRDEICLPHVVPCLVHFSFGRCLEAVPHVGCMTYLESVSYIHVEPLEEIVSRRPGTRETDGTRHFDLLIAFTPWRLGVVSCPAVLPSNIGHC